VVPQLVGLEIETARAKAAEANLAPPLTFPSWDSPETPGTVVAQEPKAGKVVQTSAALGLYVSVRDSTTALQEMHQTTKKEKR